MKGKRMSAGDAVARICDGAHVMIGGFFDCGNPEHVVREMIRLGVKCLTLTSNDTGAPGCAVYDLMFAGQVAEVNASYIGKNPETGRQMMAGGLKVNLFPQGTLAEKIRAGGAGLGGVLTQTGLDTIVEQGKQRLNIQGSEYLLELPLHADVAIVRASVADEAGNLVMRGAARNFNLVMAMAADYVIAEVDEVVPLGGIDPDLVSVPGLLVDAIVKGGYAREQP